MDEPVEPVESDQRPLVPGLPNRPSIRITMMAVLHATMLANPAHRGNHLYAGIVISSPF